MTVQNKEIGKKFIWHQTTYEIRGFVDDQVALRRWLPNKERWQYECYPHR